MAFTSIELNNKVRASKRYSSIPLINNVQTAQEVWILIKEEFHDIKKVLICFLVRNMLR